MTNISDNLSTFIGIDVSKSTLDVFVSGSGISLQVKNEESGFNELYVVLRQHNEPVVVYESTGVYGKRLAQFLLEHNVMVAEVNAYQVHSFARSTGKLAKTDRIDAETIAMYAEKIDVRLLCKVDKKHEAIRDLMKRKQQLIDYRKREKNRKESTLDHEIIVSIERHVEYLNDEIKRIEKQIDELLDQVPEFRDKVDLLTTIPGIAKQTALTVLVEMPELGTLNRKEIAMLAGLAPINHDSGKVKGKRHIYGGRPSVREALYLPTISAFKWNPKIGSFRMRLLERGKPGKVATTACMRKLVTIMNAMIRDNHAWGMKISPAQASVS